LFYVHMVRVRDRRKQKIEQRIEILER
jgi:hypothetical protein